MDPEGSATQSTTGGEGPPWTIFQWSPVPMGRVLPSSPFEGSPGSGSPVLTSYVSSSQTSRDTLGGASVSVPGAGLSVTVVLVVVLRTVP